MAVTVGMASYAAAAAAFLFLSALMVLSWRGRLAGLLLAAGAIATVLWALAACWVGAGMGSGMRVTESLEVVRTTTWMALLLVLLGYGSGRPGKLRIAAGAVLALCAVALVLTLLLGPALAAKPDASVIFTRLTLALAGLVLVEQLYRNVHPRERWGVKFLCLGLGAVFACDFYLYSDALLFRRVDPEVWAARGIVNALAVPLLAIATARNPALALDVAVSRRFVFHSTAMFGAAAYLIVMALAGYYVRYFGGRWGAVLQVTFVFGAVMLLAAILFSGTLRARLRVFLSKNFFSYRYDYREEWLRFTRTLSEGEPGAQLRERSIQAIAELVDSPGGTLWLGQENGDVELVARWNAPQAKGTIAADGPFLRFMRAREWVVDLGECAANPEAYEGLEVPEAIATMPQAWLVIPLMHHERLLGLVVLMRSQARISLDWEVNDLLKTAGRQAASYLAQLEAARALIVARQFESFNRMSAFVVHDLKNLVAQLSLLLSNAERHRHDPAFQEDMIGTVAHSVEKMSRLLFQLRGGYTLEPPVPVTLDEVLGQAVASRSALRPAPVLDVRDRGLCVVAQQVRLERVIGHLVQNAIDATPSDGSVSVRLFRQNESALIEISDTGSGMSERFLHERLFKPFESTKAAGMGIGTYEAQQYVGELGGRIDVESREGQGTVFRVRLPLHVAAVADEVPADMGAELAEGR